jgi:hypothetical protein
MLRRLDFAQVYFAADQSLGAQLFYVRAELCEFRLGLLCHGNLNSERDYIEQAHDNAFNPTPYSYSPVQVFINGRIVYALP